MIEQFLRRIDPVQGKIAIYAFIAAFAVNTTVVIVGLLALTQGADGFVGVFITGSVLVTGAFWSFHMLILTLVVLGSGPFKSAPQVQRERENQLSLEQREQRTLSDFEGQAVTTRRTLPTIHFYSDEKMSKNGQ